MLLRKWTKLELKLYCNHGRTLGDVPPIRSFDPPLNREAQEATVATKQYVVFVKEWMTCDEWKFTDKETAKNLGQSLEQKRPGIEWKIEEIPEPKP